ncbi:hypothetical protein SAMN04489841_4410 [Natrinema salaciae]|uniref:Uncharacterized protein n=1 Tax=Natrinema salaciae TaxID=1186196 RepID=A0A1H9RHT0_9EURY|nr:hypothetical protein SAMN04489841_4410 [Natrinema salaciae]
MTARTYRIRSGIDGCMWWNVAYYGWNGFDRFSAERRLREDANESIRIYYRRIRRDERKDESV